MPVREGLARLEGVESINPQPDPRAGTATLEPRLRTWLDPDLLAQRIQNTRVGARFRAIEATVRGTLEKDADQLFLRMDRHTEKWRLVPLTQKVQSNPKTGRPERPTQREQEAYDRLRSGAAVAAGFVRITGPLVKDSGGAYSSVQIRKFQWLSPEFASVESLTLGIDVNGPYGLGEPWVLIREGLQRLQPVASVSAFPNLKDSTCQIETTNGCLLNLAELANVLRELRVGASLREVEATINGIPADDGDRLILRIGGGTTKVRLAPLDPKHQSNSGTNRSKAGAAADEISAYDRLVADRKKAARPMRIIGPLREYSRDRLILDVRYFIPDPDLVDEVHHEPAKDETITTDDDSCKANEPDTIPPAAPRNLVVTVRDKLLTLDWDDNLDADFGSYNIFRSTVAASAYIQVAAGVMRSEYAWRFGNDTTPYFFVVTATDRAGNQSTYSNEVSVQSQPKNGP